MKKVLSICLGIVLLFCSLGCTSEKMLPPSNPDPESDFGIDLNINFSNIDQYIGRDDSVYIDLRMISDPAEYEQIGGDSDLSLAIKGFTCVPYPYIATILTLPVPGAYNGDSLYTIKWDASRNVVDAKANYVESEVFLNEVFPKDKYIFLCCGGGGYSFMTKQLLTYLGWDPSRIYVVGAVWTYEGDNGYELRDTKDGVTYIASWRIDYKYIDFTQLHHID